MTSAGKAPEACNVFDENMLPASATIDPYDVADILQLTATYNQQAFSNNWTLPGDQTPRGMPLMANELPLPVSLPNIWQLQHHTLADRPELGLSCPVS